MEVTPQALKKIKALSGISSEALGSLAAAMSVHRYMNGEEIVQRGKKGDSVFFILDGEVEVLSTTKSGKNYPIAVLKEGSVFGQVSLLGNVPRTATCVGKSAVITAELKRPQFQALLDKRDQGAVQFLNYMVIHLARQIRNGLDRMSQFAEKVEERVQARKTEWLDRHEDAEAKPEKPKPYYPVRSMKKQAAGQFYDEIPVIHIKDGSLDSEEVQMVENLKRIQMDLGDIDYS